MVCVFTDWVLERFSQFFSAATRRLLSSLFALSPYEEGVRSLARRWWWWWWCNGLPQYQRVIRCTTVKIIFYSGSLSLCLPLSSMPCD